MNVSVSATPSTNIMLDGPLLADTRRGAVALEVSAPMTRKYVSPTVARRFWAKVDKSGDCWLWIGNRDDYGYGRFQMGGKARKAHRVSYELTYGSTPAWLMVCHHCDTPPCVRPDHLFLGTNKDNMTDAARKGHITNAKLTEADVIAIRLAVAGGATRRGQARLYGVSEQSIRYLLARDTWAHVP